MPKISLDYIENMLAELEQSGGQTFEDCKRQLASSKDHIMPITCRDFVQVATKAISNKDGICNDY